MSHSKSHSNQESQKAPSGAHRNHSCSHQRSSIASSREVLSDQKSREDHKIHMISLGCPKNLIDSEIMLGHLSKDGYSLTGEAEEARTIVVNTCGFIEDSKKESIAKILETSKMKGTGHLKNLIVTGCLSQRYKEELLTDLPEVDVFVGSGEFQKISKIIEARESGSSQRTYYDLPTFLQRKETPRLNSQPSHRAYVKISEGCLKRCSFCAIPLIRGNLQSRPIEEIVDEVKDLVTQGVKEIIVISHDFTDYGWDLRKAGLKASPEDLLRSLGAIEGLKWIRLLYLYPDGVSPETLSIMKANPKFVRYFDMPLQHINDEMLKKMNRKMTRLEITEVLRHIREELPDAVIRTQFIVGFPGETNEQFNELIEFVKEQKFDCVGAFKYSREENTPAGKMEEQIEDRVKSKRFSKLMETQQAISAEKLQQYLGRELEVVVEGYSEETDLLLQGRAAFQAPDIDGVVLINEGEAQKGDFVRVKISDTMEYDLIGSIVDVEDTYTQDALLTKAVVGKEGNSGVRTGEGNNL